MKLLKEVPAAMNRQKLTFICLHQNDVYFLLKAVNARTMVKVKLTIQNVPFHFVFQSCFSAVNYS